MSEVEAERWFDIVWYRGFYDVPRMFAVRIADGYLLFDSPFDDALDDYAPTFGVTFIASERHEDSDWVIAAGGDGTVRETATGLIEAGLGTVLGILPLGTGNDVARLSHTATDAEFLEAARQGDTDTMDTIHVTSTLPNGRQKRHVGLLFAAVGFAGELLVSCNLESSLCQLELISAPGSP